MNILFMTQSLMKKRKLEEDKTDEYYEFKTSEDSEDDDIFNVVLGHAVSAVAFEMTSQNPGKKEAITNFATVCFGNKVLTISLQK